MGCPGARWRSRSRWQPTNPPSPPSSNGRLDLPVLSVGDDMTHRRQMRTKGLHCLWSPAAVSGVPVKAWVTAPPTHPLRQPIEPVGAENLVCGVDLRLRRGGGSELAICPLSDCCHGPVALPLRGSVTTSGACDSALQPVGASYSVRPCDLLGLRISHSPNPVGRVR